MQSPRQADTLRARVEARRSRKQKTVNGVNAWQTFRQILANLGALLWSDPLNRPRRPEPKVSYPTVARRYPSQTSLDPHLIQSISRPVRRRRAHSGIAGVLAQVREAQRAQFFARAAPLLLGLVVLAVCVLVFLPHRQPVEAADALPTPTLTPDALANVKPPDGLTRILVLGTDHRPQDETFRTDVIMLFTIDGSNGRASVVSFPRDLVLNLPGYGDSRINTTMEYGGFKLFQQAFTENYGVTPDYYFMINFQGFVGLINSVGGIEIDAAQPLEDACDLPQQKKGACSILQGKVSMDGATALWYVRSRHTSSDFDRLRRTQEVMEGIFARFMEMKAIQRVPELYTQYRQDVETNMKATQVLSMMPIAVQVAKDTSRLQRYAISPAEAADWIDPFGARVLLPNPEAIRRIIRQASFEE